MTQINVCIANKQMHDKHKDQLPLPQARLKGQRKLIDKEQGKTKHEATRSVNYRATQNKNNIRTTGLERSVVYTSMGGGGCVGVGGVWGGVKDLSLYKLHPGSRYSS